MNIWIDAQLSPSLAAWINRSFEDVHAQSLRSLGLRDAPDQDIFQQARKREAVIMTKDDDFLKLVAKYKAPPYIILITCGNTSNAVMRTILQRRLLQAVAHLRKGEPIVEIKG